LIQRRKQHKNCCNNENGKVYNRYVYQFIRENGGFENWDVVLIEDLADCKDKENLHRCERHYIESLKAELNKYIPLRTHKEWCEENKDYHKEWYKENKDYCKENQELNKKTISQQKMNGKKNTKIK
jgi:hypothetical protein